MPCEVNVRTAITVELRQDKVAVSARRLEAWRAAPDPQCVNDQARREGPLGQPAAGGERRLLRMWCDDRD
jgi:hypothetical protein